MGLWGSTYVTHHLLLTCWSNLTAWKRVICSAAELCTSFNFNSRSSFLNLAKVIGNGMRWGHNSPVTWEGNILWHESHSSQAIICHTYAIVSQSAGVCMYNSIETRGMLDTYSYIGYPWLSKCSQNATKLDISLRFPVSKLPSSLVFFNNSWSSHPFSSKHPAFTKKIPDSHGSRCEIS